MMPLAIVIPTHGRPTLLAQTLRSVAACERPEGYIGCFVIENGLQDGAEAVVADVARECPEAEFQYLHHARANKSAALNAALTEAEDQTLCVFFDDDVQVEPGALVAYAQAASPCPDGCAFFGGPLQCDFEEPPPSWMLPMLPFSASGFTLQNAEKKGYFLGANWAAFSQDLRAVGLFDPNYGPGSPSGARGQEKNMQLRLREAGCKSVAVPSAVVRHYVPKERCSPSWANQRAQQMGLQRGSQALAEGKLGLLANALRRVPRHVIRLVVYSLRSETIDRQRTLNSLSTDFGIIRGYWVGRTRSSATIQLS